ncbi:hypothetical protein ACFQZR_10145 [Paenibacillus sp. GCM10027629]
MFYRFPIDQQLSNSKLADGASEDGAIGYAWNKDFLLTSVRISCIWLTGLKT